MQEDSAAVLLACIEAEQLRLREILSGWDESVLATPPKNGKWSVVENVRHLLFAEQLHLGRFAADGPQFSAIGVPPTGMLGDRRIQPAGTRATSSTDEVLDVWQATHASTRDLVREDTPVIRKALDRHLRHLRAHIKVIERLFRTRQ